MSHTLTLSNNSINDLKDTNRKRSRFTGTGLCLGNGIATFTDLDNRTRLDRRRRLISVCINTAKKALLQVHIQIGRAHV